MRNTWKKAAAFAMALALVAGAAPANVGTGGLFGGSAITAKAAPSEPDSGVKAGTVDIGTTVSWDADEIINLGTGSFSKDGVTVEEENNAHINSNFYDSGKNTFKADGGKITKIEIVCHYCDDNIDGWSREAVGQYQPEPEGDPDWWENINKLTWTGEADSVSIQNAVYEIQSIKVTYIPSATDISTATVTWDSSNLSSLYVNNTSQTIDGITIKSNATFVTSYWYDEVNYLAFEADASGGYTFTNTLGKNFTKIEIMANWDWDSSIVNALGSGWSYANRKATWTGNAASVDLFTESSYLNAGAFSIVFTLAPEATAAPTFSNASVTLGDDLALNFYVDGIADETAAAEYSVKFEGECVDKTSALAYNAAEDKYYATTHIYAKDINQKITAKLYKGENECGTSQISVADYLNTLAASPDKKTQALALATKLFGDASAAYFNPTETVNDTSVAAEITTYMTQANISDAALTAMSAQYAPTFDSDAAKLSLVLDSKTAARLYVKEDTTGTESAINATKADYPTYHEVAGLLPQNLADEQTINVGGTDYKFSALSWCYRVLTNDSASQKNINMAKAIMAYYEAAKAYTTVDVASVAITNAPTEAIKVGNTGTLTATVSPDNATNKTVTWAVTEGTDVLSINAATGAYTALKAGTAKVTATADGKTAECTITVMAENKETLTLSHTTGTYFGLTASLTSNLGWRMYGGSTINISSTNGKTIKKVELTIAGNANSRNLNNFAVSSGTKTANGTTNGCIVTISDVNATTLTLTDNNSNAAKQYVFNKAVIYFE